MSDVQPNLKQLVEELQPITTKWRQLGLFLDVPDDELEAIEEDKKNIHDKLYALCFKWLEVKRRVSWKDIVKALKKMKRLGLADRLEQKYVIVKHTTSSDLFASEQSESLRKSLQDKPVIVPMQTIDTMALQLHNALSSHNSEEALHLLSLLSNPHKVKYFPSNSTILHRAAWYGVLDIVQVLINEYQFDPHCVNDIGNTPLHYAAMNGQLNIIKYLITECHCNPLSKDKYGDTPLHYAAMNGQLNIIKYLITECHCNPLSKDKYGDTPLHYANTNRHQDVVQYLESIVTADRLLEAMKEGGGKMKPRNITMHGPPGAGKTSLKRVIIGLSPLPSEEQNATDIVENAVRAVSTDRITADGRRSVMLTEVDNEELIKMLARKVESHRVTSHQTQEPQHKPVSTVCVSVSVCVCLHMLIFLQLVWS